MISHYYIIFGAKIKMRLPCFIVDHHPNYPNILMAAGFYGHGFKFTNLVGKLLKDFVTKNNHEYDLSLFKLQRFL